MAAPGQVGACHANEESGGTSEGRGHNQRAGPGGGQALGPSRSRPRGQRHRGTSFACRAQMAPITVAGQASISTEGQEVTLSLSTLTLLTVCRVSKDKR